MYNLKRYAITYKEHYNSYLGSCVYSKGSSEHTTVVMAKDEKEARRIANATYGSDNIIRIKED